MYMYMMCAPGTISLSLSLALSLSLSLSFYLCLFLSPYQSILARRLKLFRLFEYMFQFQPISLSPFKLISPMCFLFNTPSSPLSLSLSLSYSLYHILSLSLGTKFVIPGKTKKRKRILPNSPFSFSHTHSLLLEHTNLHSVYAFFLHFIYLF